jgi:hypothetical protein
LARRCHKSPKRITGEGYTDRQQGDLISLLLFSENKESRPKIDHKGTGWKAVDWIHLAGDRKESGAVI